MVSGTLRILKSSALCGHLKTNVDFGGKIAMIYCYLITPQVVSDKKFRRLKTCIHQTAFCNQVFENAYYVPIERQKFRDIRIKMANASGNLMAFKDSRTPAYVVLYFVGAVFIHRI